MSIFKGIGAFFAAAVATAVTVRDCAPDRSLFAITDLRLEPSTPSAGQTVALTLSYDVPQGVTITDGTSIYRMTFNFIPLTPTTHPLCQDVACPITGGSHTNTTQTQWPQGVTGNFKSQMEWRGAQDELLLCVEMAGAVLLDEGEEPDSQPSLRGAERS
jgi:hypothetical protein